MIVRVGLIAAVLGLGVLAFWHPARRAAVEPVSVGSGSAPRVDATAGPRRSSRRVAPADGLVVYVVGAVRKPGLYRLRPGDRYAKAVAMAGGFSHAADAAGVNLAQRASDGEEIDVPVAGAMVHRIKSERSSRRRATPPPIGSVDVNAADAAQLGAVPGIGRAVAGRIVALRAREGSFASIDELLDVAGMTQSRLERARPYLRDP